MYMKWIIVCVLSLFFMSVIPNYCYCGVTTPVLVVYGIFSDQHGTPVSEDYLITIKNVSKGDSLMTYPGTGGNAGKYCVVFIDYNDNNAAEEGDTIRIEVKRESDNFIVYVEEYTVTVEDIIERRVEFMIIATPNETYSWGAIKALF